MHLHAKNWKSIHAKEFIMRKNARISKLVFALYVVGASSCISQDARLNFARLSHKTWGARFARQRFTKNSILLAKNWVFSKNSSNESSKKKL